MVAIKRLFGKLYNKDLASITDENGRKIKFFALLIPLYLESISSVVMGLVQSIMSSRYMGGFLVIPINIVNTIIGIMGAVLLMPTTGLSILLSVNIGRKKHEDCKKLIGNTFFVVVAIAFIFAVIFFVFADQIVTVMGMDGAEYFAYKPYAIEYLKYRAVMLLALQWYTVFTTAMRCYGLTTPGFIANFSINAFNAIFTAIVFFVIKTPMESAITALSIAMALSMLIGTVYSVIAFYKNKLKVSFRPRKNYFLAILKVGFPASLTNISYSFSQTITTKICMALTPVIYQTKLYASQLLPFSYMMGACMAKSNGILIGRACGMGDFDVTKKMARQGLRLSIVANLSIALALFIFARPLMTGLFVATEEMVMWARIIFLIDIFVELGRAFGHTGENVLSAVGDTSFMAIVSMLSCWIIGIGLAFVAVEYLALGIVGMWVALAIDESTRGVCFLTRWKRGKWKRNFEKKTSVK